MLRNSWCEIHPFYTDQTEDARMVERYTEKVKKQNSGRGNKKIEGAWRNPFHKRNDDEIQFPSLSKSDTGRRYNGNTTSQGADIQFPREKKKSMEIFLRDPAGVVPKGVPPDKSVGACPSVQEKTTGIGNVGKSP